MLDPILREVKDRMFDPVADALGSRVRPNGLTGLGFLAGVACAWALGSGAVGWAFGLWAANRVLDALDGAVARRTGRSSDLGGYLDLISDFVVYALIPIGAVLGQPDDPTLLLTLSLLLAAFYVNAASWMYLSAILEKRRKEGDARPHQTVVAMPTGVVGGSETLILYTLIVLMPERFVLVGGIMAILVAAGILRRIGWAVRWLR